MWNKINMKIVVVTVVWFNWRNKQEKYLSTKIKPLKTRWRYKVYLQNCGVFPTGKITEWYTWSSQQWDATTEENYQTTAANKHWWKMTTKHNNDCLNTEREKNAIT